MDQLHLKCGDVLGFQGGSWVSRCISALTYGPLSHVAIVAPWQGRLLLVESTTLDSEPCLIQGKRVQGVQAHPLYSWLDYDGRVWHYPCLRPVNATALESFVGMMLGKPYDTFGAWESGGLGLRARLHQPDMTKLFCSELVAAAHIAAGAWHCMDAADYNPNHLVRAEQADSVLGKGLRLK